MRPIIRVGSRLWLIAGIILISSMPLLSGGDGHSRPGTAGHVSIGHRPVAKLRRSAHLVAGLPSRDRAIEIGLDPEDDPWSRARRSSDRSLCADGGRVVAMTRPLPTVCGYSHGARLMRC
jgi:hypothetical protein